MPPFDRRTDSITLSAELSLQGFTNGLVGLSVSLTYLLGLAILWMYTPGGRRAPKRRGESADQQRRPSSRVPRVGQLRKTCCTRPTGPE